MNSKFSTRIISKEPHTIIKNDPQRNSNVSNQLGKRHCTVTTQLELSTHNCLSPPNALVRKMAGPRRSACNITKKTLTNPPFQLDNHFANIFPAIGNVIN